MNGYDAWKLASPYDETDTPAADDFAALARELRALANFLDRKATN